MPGIGFSGVANGAFTTTGKASGVGGINAGSSAGAGVGGTGVISTFVTVPPGPTVIGEAFGGGYYAGQLSTTGTGVADYYLIVAPVSTGQTGSQYKTSNTIDSTWSVIDGPANSASINDAAHPAAFFCEGLTIGGFTDWYLPAILELEIAYFNLKPSTDANITSTGTNAYSVPPRASNYTSGNPAQTTATDFKSGGSQQFADGATQNYISSTQATTTRVNAKGFQTGGASTPFKSTTAFILARAVRRVPV